MPVEVTTQGADQVAVVGRLLKAAGNGELRRELYRGINSATKPLKGKIREAALRDLPKRGGLNQFVAGAKITTSTKTGGRNAGVTLKVRKAGHDIKAIDRGRVRHPVFGTRRVWVNQTVPAGFASKTVDAEAPAIRREVVTVLDDIARKIARSG